MCCAPWETIWSRIRQNLNQKTRRHHHQTSTTTNLKGLYEREQNSAGHRALDVGQDGTSLRPLRVCLSDGVRRLDVTAQAGPADDPQRAPWQAWLIHGPRDRDAPEHAYR